MRSNNSRVRRILGAALGALVATVGMSVINAAPAAADGCTIICGGVHNDADHTMHYTRALGTSTQANECDVWNINGGNNWNWASRVKCGQRSLGKGQSAGGFWSGFDVDAFSFNNHSYQVSFNGGSYRTLNQGVWTKIRDLEFATCRMHNGNIRCDIIS